MDSLDRRVARDRARALRIRIVEWENTADAYRKRARAASENAIDLARELDEIEAELIGETGHTDG